MLIVQVLALTSAHNVYIYVEGNIHFSMLEKLCIMKIDAKWNGFVFSRQSADYQARRVIP